MSLNLNEFARTITLKEGGKISLPIGQVKEVIKITLEELTTLEPLELFKILKKYE